MSIEREVRSTSGGWRVRAVVHTRGHDIENGKSESCSGTQERGPGSVLCGWEESE